MKEKTCEQNSMMIKQKETKNLKMLKKINDNKKRKYEQNQPARVNKNQTNKTKHMKIKKR